MSNELVVNRPGGNHSQMLSLNLLTLLCILVKEAAQAKRTHVFAHTADGFLLDGQHFRLYAGEMHYFRVAPCGWHDRLVKLQLAGLNAVSTAIEWAAHEPMPQEYVWGGDVNFTHFVEVARQLDLFVILRAGPFIGADRDLGGLPGWLLNVNSSETREWLHSVSAAYRSYAERWLGHLLPRISQMMVSNGGPVLLVQIDSDLGSSGSCEAGDWLLDIFASYLGRDTVFLTMDDNVYQNIFCGKLSGIIPGFRTDPEDYFDRHNKSMTSLFSALTEVAPGYPRVVEMRTGKAWSWGGDRSSFGPSEVADALSDLLDQNATVILYMFAGGTNFERAGHAGNFTMGMITSYDYDALLDEGGDLTDKFSKVRAVLHGHRRLHMDKLPPSKQDVRALYGGIRFISIGSFFDQDIQENLGGLPVFAPDPLSFKEMGVSTGIVLYETVLPYNVSTRGSIEIRCHGVRDRGYVYIGRVLAGILNHAGHFTLNVNPLPGENLHIIVESQGHVARGLISEPKGIVTNVLLGSSILRNWTMYAFPLTNIAGMQNAIRKLNRRRPRKRGNGLYRATFVAPMDMTVTLDSFLEISKLGKGQAFLNGRSLGKYWPRAGPQQTLYIPGCFVRPYPMVNQLFIIEMQRPQAGGRKIQTFFVSNNKASVGGYDDYDKEPRSSNDHPTRRCDIIFFCSILSMLTQSHYLLYTRY